MKSLKRTKKLYKKYLNRTATPAELDELFSLLRDRSRFDQLHDLFGEEWESDDVSFTADKLSWEQIQVAREQRRTGLTAYREKKKRIRWQAGSWKWAAAAAVLILAGMALWLFLQPAEKVYQTGYGETMNIVLDDGSKVTLNANSTLKWNPDWEDNKERKVLLEGEAFFEVSHRLSDQDITGKMTDESERLMPFRVVTPDLTVNVLGTEFNVQARHQKTGVFLKSGKVLLTTNHQSNTLVKEIQNNTQSDNTVTAMDSIYLSPGDYVSYSGISRKLEHNTDKPTTAETSWKDGFLVYENERLQNVLNNLEDIYGKKFTVEDETMLSRKVILGMPYEDWETVAGLMSLSLELQLIQDGDQVIVIEKQGK